MVVPCLKNYAFSSFVNPMLVIYKMLSRSAYGRFDMLSFLIKIQQTFVGRLELAATSTLVQNIRIYVTTINNVYYQSL